MKSSTCKISPAWTVLLGVSVAGAPPAFLTPSFTPHSPQSRGVRSDPQAATAGECGVNDGVSDRVQWQG